MGHGPLTSAERKKIPSKEFAGPDRSYPITDADHAVAAKAFSTRAVARGKMSADEKAHIDSMADRMLKKSGEK